MKRYMGHCSGNNGRFAAEMRTRPFSLICPIAIYMISKRIALMRSSIADSTSKSALYPTDPVKKEHLVGKSRFRRTHIDRPTPRPRRTFGRRIEIAYDVSMGPFWIKDRGADDGLFILLTIRPNHRETWSVTYSPPRRVPPLYYGDVDQKQKRNSSMSGNREHRSSTDQVPNSTHAPRSSSSPNRKREPAVSLAQVSDQGNSPPPFRLIC